VCFTELSTKTLQSTRLLVNDNYFIVQFSVFYVQWQSFKFKRYWAVIVKIRVDGRSFHVGRYQCDEMLHSRS